MFEVLVAVKYGFGFALGVWILFGLNEFVHRLEQELKSWIRQVKRK